MCEYKAVPSLQFVRQPPNLALNPRTNSNHRTVLGLRLQPQNFLVFGGLQHAPGTKYVVLYETYCAVVPSRANLEYFGRIWLHVFQSLAVLLHTFCCLSTESTLPGKFFGFSLPQPTMVQLTPGLLLLICSYHVGYYVYLLYNAVGSYDFAGLFISQWQYSLCCWCGRILRPNHLSCIVPFDLPICTDCVVLVFHIYVCLLQYSILEK